MESRYRAITAQAWAGMLALLLTMFIVDLVRFSIAGKFDEMSQSLADDPGSTGLGILVGMICLNALVQVAVHTFEAAPFRKLVFGISAAYTAFFVVHQIVHVAGGEGLSLHTGLDLTHHALGLWACWASWRWSRSAAATLPGRQSAPRVA